MGPPPHQPELPTSVTLSAAKGLSGWAARSFAALRMTAMCLPAALRLKVMRIPADNEDYPFKYHLLIQAREGRPILREVGLQCMVLNLLMGIIGQI